MQVQNLNIVKPVNTAGVAGATENSGAAVRNGNHPEQELKLNNEKKHLDEAIDYANKAIEGSNRYFKYEVYGPGKDVVISVMDSTTDQVIQEIPAKKLLDVVNNLMELAGLVVDERR